MGNHGEQGDTMSRTGIHRPGWEGRSSAWYPVQCNAQPDSSCILVSSSSLLPACADQHSKPHPWLP